MKGYTLVELLIVVSLVGILSAVGVASYISFNRNQVVLQTAKKVVQDLRLAQSLAANNQKPLQSDGTLDPACEMLVNYAFEVDSATSYHLQLNCSNNYTPQSPVKSVELPSGMTFNTSALSVKFLPLQKGIVSSGPLTLQVMGFNKTKIITIDPGGAINVSE